MTIIKEIWLRVWPWGNRPWPGPCPNFVFSQTICQAFFKLPHARDDGWERRNATGAKTTVTYQHKNWCWSMQARHKPNDCLGKVNPMYSLGVSIKVTQWFNDFNSWNSNRSRSLRRTHLVYQLLMRGNGHSASSLLGMNRANKSGCSFMLEQDFPDHFFDWWFWFQWISIRNLQQSHTEVRAGVVTMVAAGSWWRNIHRTWWSCCCWGSWPTNKGWYWLMIVNDCVWWYGYKRLFDGSSLLMIHDDW